MNDPVYERLRQLAWRRKLTEAELAEWRAASPENATDAELEVMLSETLVRLPDAPVPSNFTARVLQEIERDAKRPDVRQRGRGWIWRVLVPRIAAAVLVVGTGAFAIHHHQAKQREAIGNSLVKVATVPSLPSPEALENFDVIRKLGSDTAADKELIALLQ